MYIISNFHNSLIHLVKQDLLSSLFYRQEMGAQVFSITWPPQTLKLWQHHFVYCPDMPSLPSFQLENKVSVWADVSAEF